MEDIVAMLTVIDWIADDIHYNSRGASFYGLHLMADKIRDFGDSADELKERYWLGFLDTTPPSGKYFAQKAISLYGRYEGLGYLDAAKKAAMDLVDMVKTTSSEKDLPNGVSAILDEISSHALLCSFFASASKSKAE